MRRAVVLVGLAACGRVGFGPGDGNATTLVADITVVPGVTVTALAARIQFSSLDANALSALPTALPATQTFALPDDSGPLTIELDAVDARGCALTPTATTDIVAGGTQHVSIVVGDDVAPTCFDGVRDGDEAAIDCGGSCPACAVGAECAAAADCVTGNCAASGTCEPATGTPSWLPIADMPIARLGLAAERGSDGRIYVFGGGLIDGEPDAEVDAYDPDLDQWSAAPPLPTPRDRITGAIDASGTIYAIGGEESSSVIETFVPGQAQWQTGPSLPTPRGYSGAVTDAAGGIHVIGGAMGDPTVGADLVTAHEVLSTGGSWGDDADLPAARSDASAAIAADGTIWMVGGRLPAVTNTVVAYDPAADAWTTLPSLTNVHSDLGAVRAPDGRVFAVGGFDGAGALTSVEAARVNGAWTAVASLSTPRDALAVALGADGRIFAFGGRQVSNSDGSDSAEVYGPLLAVSARSASPGTQVIVSGTNFAVDAIVTILFDNIPVERATTDSTGVFASATVIVPSGLAPGPHAIEAVDDHSVYPVSFAFAVE